MFCLSNIKHLFFTIPVFICAIISNNSYSNDSQMTSIVPYGMHKKLLEFQDDKDKMFYPEYKLNYGMN
ncbi:MAG: hypothetical protein IJ848_03730 [Alphaproteobacteria bacterium]|nr:hypothetical protein [Alphaproteobacteria bacterium]